MLAVRPHLTPWNLEPALLSPGWEWFWGAVSLATITWERGGDPILYGRGGKRIGVGAQGDALWLPGGGLDPSALTSQLQMGTSDPLVQGDLAWVMVLENWSAPLDGFPEPPILKRIDDLFTDEGFRWEYVFQYNGSTVFNMNQFAFNSFPTSVINIPRTLPPGSGISVVGVTDDGTDTRLYVDGEQAGDAGGTLVFTGGATPTQPVQLGNLNAGQELAATIHAAYLFGRALTVAEHGLISADPFGPVRHYLDNRTQRVHGFGAAGGFFSRRYYDEFLAGDAA